MAKTTPKNGKKGANKEPTGPVLVEDPPETAAEPVPAEPIPVEDDSEEEETAEAAEASAPDPRRVPPSSNLTSTQLWEFIQQYPSPEDLDLYCYRLFPVIAAGAPADWTGGGKWPTYQEKLKGLVTQQTGRVADYEWLRSVRGSGTYHIRLIDRRLKRTQNRQVCEAKVEINEWDTHPPVLNDWSELVPCEANKWIIQRMLKDKIIKRTPEGGFVGYEATAAQEPVQQNGSGESRMLETALRFAERAYTNNRPAAAPAAFTGKDIVDLMTKTQQANDPQKLITAAQGLIQISKPGEDPMLKFVLDRLAAAETRSTMLMEKLLTPAPATATVTPPADPLRDIAIELLKKRLEKMDDTPAAESAADRQSRMNGTQELISEITKSVAPVFDNAIKLFTIMAAQKQQPAPATARPGRPQTVDVAATQPQQDAPPAAQPEPEPAAAPPSQPTMEQVQQNVLNMVLGQATTSLQKFLSEGDDTDNGVTAGELFASWFCDSAFKIPAPPPFDRISGVDALAFAKQFGSAAILAAYKLNSSLYQQIAPNTEAEEKFIRFLDAFLKYDPNAEQEPED